MYSPQLFSIFIFFFSSRRRHTRLQGDWSSDVCSSDLAVGHPVQDELRLLRAVGVEAHVAEEEARVPRGPLGLPHETRGDDAVGVDVGKIDRRGDRGEAREGLHQFALDAATDAWQDKWHEPTGAKFPPSPSGADVPPPS